MQQANQKVSGGDDYQPVGLYHPDNYPLREQSFETQADSRAHLKPTTYPPTADPEKGNTYGSRPALSNNSSWTPLKNLEEELEHFDPRKARDPNLIRAEGDAATDPVSRLYHYLLNVSIITRWIIYIVPVLAILWIPGILGLTRFPDSTIFQVKLLWWSIWLSVVWAGWWAALFFCAIIPRFARVTIGLVAVGSRRYIAWLAALQRYVALASWTLCVWIAWKPLLDNNYIGSSTDSGQNALSILGKLLFAFFLCSAFLLGEKLSIQWIADKFHQRSYQDRIADQRNAFNILVTLYINSKNIVHRSDTLSDPVRQPQSTRFFKRALRGVRSVATTSTTIFGNVLSEIVGTSVLQPNSPAAIVQTCLQSANKSRLLARRLFYSFVQPKSNALVVSDISSLFKTPEATEAAFNLLDKDSNGDVDRDEMELAIVDLHREQLAIEHSLQDLDSAVGRLDNILVSLVTIISLLIIAIALQASLATIVTGAGTLILGLSWLIGGTAQEVLTSIIFLFVKHPFDVSDRIIINGKDTYTVKEIHLLSTVFVDPGGCIVQAPNVMLNTSYIQNLRRSSLMSEPFNFEVSYATTYAQLQELREKMLVILKDSSRDFLAVFDVSVIDIPDQTKMVLKADIKYKSNWQQAALKATRRNKWICALKTALAETEIYGSAGNTSAPVPPTKYTLVPYEQVERDEKQLQASVGTEATPPIGGWQLADKNAVLVGSSSDIFQEAEDLRRTNPRRGAEASRMHFEGHVSGEPSTNASSSRQRSHPLPVGAQPRDVESVDLE